MTDKILTNRQAIGVLDGLWSNPLFGETHRQAFEIGIKAIKALEQEPCEDTIRRAEVIKAIDEREDVNGKVDAESVRTDIVLMHSVTPRPIQGRWIKKEYWEPLAWDTFPAICDEYDEKTHSIKEYRYYCSHCNYQARYILTKFCPECGVKMDKPQKSEDKT